ncbi:MAG TPA: BMP family ABC transporter substrate-binding protein [Spirochaetia bacterium]
MKKILSIVVVFGIALAVLVGCGGASKGPKSQKVVYLINGALGDNAFYDSGKAGIDAIAAQYKVETRTIECNFDAAKYQPALQAAVDYADVIFVISYGFEDQLKEIADKNPSKTFVNIDTVVENSKKTITSVDYVEEDSAYLTGVTAGLTTLDTSLKGVNTAKVVGVVGGDTDPVVSAFVFAYINGAKSVDPQIRVLAKSLGGAWDDTAKAKQAALQLYDQKADVVFQVASAAGIGVLQAAKERGLYAIGVDTNQNDMEPGFVIASDVKNVGASIESVFKAIKDGTYKPGQLIESGIAQGGVDVTFDAKVQVLPQTIVDKVKDIRQQIIDGSLKVERYNGQDVWK